MGASFVVEYERRDDDVQEFLTQDTRAYLTNRPRPLPRGSREDWGARERPRVSHANGARRRSGARGSVSGSPRGEAPRIRLVRRGVRGLLFLVGRLVGRLLGRLRRGRGRLRRG